MVVLVLELLVVEVGRGKDKEPIDKRRSNSGIHNLQVL